MATTLPETAGTARWDLRRTLVLLTALLLSAVGVRAHAAYAQPVAHYYSPAEMQQLVGPIALYVDDLIGIVLPASAYPDQVIAAANFLDARQQDPSLQPDPYWDDSVVALLNYPEVLRLLADNPRWMRQLGEAFVYQQSDLLNAIQRFREQAMVAGNLYSDDYQNVTQSEGVIAIAPANPQVVYVPYYSPTQVIQYYPGPAISYYPYGYPLYDYPYPAGYNFSAGFFWGVSTAFIVSWHSHLVNVFPWDYDRHPYYRYRSRYQQPYYVRHLHRDRDWDRHEYAWRRDDRYDARHRHDDERNYPDRQHRYTTGAFNGGAMPATPRGTSQTRYPNDNRQPGDSRGARNDYRGDRQPTPNRQDGSSSQTFTQSALDRAWTQRNLQDGSRDTRDTSQTFTQAALDRARAQAQTRDRNRAGADSRVYTPPTRTVTPPPRTVAPPARTVTPPPWPSTPTVAPTRRAPPVRYAPPQERGGVKVAPARQAQPPARSSVRSSPPPRQSNGRSADTSKGRLNGRQDR